MPLCAMPSQGGPASDEEPAAIAALSEIRRSLAEERQRYMGFVRLDERQLYMGALHQPYMRLYYHGDRINNEIQAMQAARGVVVPASTRGMGGMAARPRHWATPDTTAETPYSKAAAGWRPNVGLVIRAAPPGISTRAAASTSSVDGGRRRREASAWGRQAVRVNSGRPGQDRGRGLGRRRCLRRWRWRGLRRGLRGRRGRRRLLYAVSVCHLG